jgi:hypothetical protein
MEDRPFRAALRESKTGFSPVVVALAPSPPHFRAIAFPADCATILNSPQRRV